MKIGRRGLFGLGAAVAAAPVALVAAKPAGGYATSPLDLIRGDLAEMTSAARANALEEQYKAEFIAGFERQIALLDKAVVTERTYAGGVYWIAEERPDGVFAHPIAEKE